MKRSIVVALFAILSTASAFAQEKNPLSPILTAYLGIKDALVTGDANLASSHASEFLLAIDAVDMNKLPAKDHSSFMTLKDKLGFDARHISEMKKLDHQREHFATLSNNMYTLAKSARLSSEPVYKDFCPMKKSSWLSMDKDIKNPYYGNAMLTCGQITETIKP